MAVHLCLLSLANGWPLSLSYAKQLCEVFCGDIRRAFLHFQFTLSWQPSDPAAAEPPFDNITQIFQVTPTPAYHHRPWADSNTLCHSQGASLSCMDKVCLLAEWKSEMNYIHDHDHSTHPKGKLRPSLVDDLPETEVSRKFSFTFENAGTFSHVQANSTENTRYLLLSCKAVNLGANLAFLWKSCSQNHGY